MIYNFNLGIGWASSGVEYAQSYRAKIFRSIGQEARFIFTDMFPVENIEHMTANIGFSDEEVIWLYTFFTDTGIAPVTYTLSMLEETFPTEFTKNREGKIVKYLFPGLNNFATAYMVNETEDRVHRVELVSKGCLIRKDYFTYCRIYSEYYAPLDGKAHLYHRRFFNQDGTTAYEEINDDDHVMYQFPDRLICSKVELVGYMVDRLQLTEEDVVIIDRSTDIGQPILMHAGPAKVGIVIHADHFSEEATDNDYILWNNYYEYDFAMHRHIRFYIAATDAQNTLVRQQFHQYMGIDPDVYTIPVGSLAELKAPGPNGRKKHALITASRLASEKHVDWMIEAVAVAAKIVPDISLDIYGMGGEEKQLRELIEKLKLGGSVRLMGQHNLTEVYQNYDAYLSASTSEGFGLTLMEAIGAGLPIIGFDVRYGNQTFIEDGKTGYLIPVHANMGKAERVKELASRIVKLFTEADLEEMHECAYAKGKEFLTIEVEKKWANLLEEIKR